MANRKITDFNPLVNITNLNSVLEIVDLDEGDIDLRNKKITFADLSSNVESQLAFGTGTLKITSADTTPDFLQNKLIAGTDIGLVLNNPGGVETLTINYTGTGSTDELVTVSSNDTSPGSLDSKLIAGTLISLTENNDGGNETLTIDFTGSDTDELSKVSANDTTAGFLFEKIVGSTNISIAELNNGADEDLEISFTGIATDELSKVSANDTTAGFLFDKITAGTNISIAELNDGADEDLEISFTGFPQLVAEATGTINANDKELIPIDVTGAVATVNPPASPVAGFRFAVSDSRGNSATNNITVDFITATQNFHAAAANKVLSNNNEYAEFIYIDATIGWIQSN